MRALVLSGGGALGAFQVGAEKYAREKYMRDEQREHPWDLIAGVSVGALNGAMLAMHKYDRLEKVWHSEMSDGRVYGLFGRWLPTGLLRLMSWYSGRALRRLVDRELRQGEFRVPLRVGAVDLMTGQYRTFNEKHADIRRAVLASAAVPIISPPVRVGADPWLVDGGIRNTSPIGDVLKANCDQIVIISCFPKDPPRLSKPPRTLVGIGVRSYEVMANEILQEDIKEFELINTLVQQAAKNDVVLRDQRPDRDERTLRYVRPYHIFPEASLGDGLDFSQAEARRRLELGRERAKAILG